MTIDSLTPADWCTDTAREQASPTASFTSSMTTASRPIRRPSAAATSRAVRTLTGNALMWSSTLGMATAAPSGG